MPPRRQALHITNANTFRSYLQLTTSGTVKILVFDDPNQFFFAIFKSLVLKFADSLYILKYVVDVLPPWFSFSEEKFIRQVFTFFQFL